MIHSNIKQVIITLLIGVVAGCGEQSNAELSNNTLTLDEKIEIAINQKQLQERGKKGEELSYQMNKDLPFSGWQKRLYDSGQIAELNHYKEGKLDGISTWWHQNGQKHIEKNWKQGLEHGEDKRWYSNGQLECRTLWENNKLVFAEVWKPNGEKCTDTSIEEGHGMVLFYRDNGSCMGGKFYEGGKHLLDIEGEEDPSTIRLPHPLLIDSRK